MFKNIVDRLIGLIEKFSAFEIVIFLTTAVVFASIICVYIVTLLAGVVYRDIFLLFSIVLPLLLSPPLILLVIKLTKHLYEYKSFLSQEIQKSKEKDVIMYEQERFVFMGEMMANISHQWKQPLNTISLSIVDAKVSLYDPKKVERSFDIIENNVNYLASTVDDFLSFFDQKRYRDLKTLSEILSEVQSIYGGTLLANGIEFKVELANDAKDIVVAASIVQIILNLLSNAKDALHDSKENKSIVLRLITLDNMLKIRCCDSGQGVNESVMKSIFDPYFTTKEKKQGTGLGLYMSKQIVHVIFDGDIYVDMFNHACFIVDLPYGENCMLEKK